MDKMFVYYGGPHCGKTSQLINRMAEAMKSGKNVLYITMVDRADVIMEHLYRIIGNTELSGKGHCIELPSGVSIDMIMAHATSFLPKIDVLIIDEANMLESKKYTYADIMYRLNDLRKSAIHNDMSVCTAAQCRAESVHEMSCYLPNTIFVSLER